LSRLRPSDPLPDPPIPRSPDPPIPRSPDPPIPRSPDPPILRSVIVRTCGRSRGRDDTDSAEWMCSRHRRIDSHGRRSTVAATRGSEIWRRDSTFSLATVGFAEILLYTDFVNDLTRQEIFPYPVARASLEPWLLHGSVTARFLNGGALFLDQERAVLRLLAGVLPCEFRSDRHLFPVRRCRSK
jgi:hypothetical protein